MKTDWQEFFESCLRPEFASNALAMNMENMYQAFKARLIDELGIKISLEWNTEKGVVQGYAIHDKSQKHN